MLFSSFFVCVFLSVIFVLFLFMVGYFISFKFYSSYDSKTAYECGFDALTSDRVAVSLGFFLVCVIFVLFSVEVILVIPAVNMVYFWSSEVFFVNLFLFLFILLAGLVYEWYSNSLEWFS